MYTMELQERLCKHCLMCRRCQQRLAQEEERRRKEEEQQSAQEEELQGAGAEEPQWQTARRIKKSQRVERQRRWAARKAQAPLVPVMTQTMDGCTVICCAASCDAGPAADKAAGDGSVQFKTSLATERADA